MANVKIIYCVPCGFRGRAEELKKNLENKGHKVALEGGEHGIFDVYSGRKPVFSRFKEDRFPEADEILKKL